MRKFIMGAMVGFLLAFAFPVYAEVSNYIGKTVTNEYTVVVDGVELEQKAIAVDGRSFTPNRALADAVGYDVVFDAQNKKVIFTKKMSDPIIENNISNDNGDVSGENSGGDDMTTYPWTLDQINALIENTEDKIIFAQERVKKAEEIGDTKQADEMRDYIQRKQKELERYKQIKDELEAQQ